METKREINEKSKEILKKNPKEEKVIKEIIKQNSNQNQLTFNEKEEILDQEFENSLDFLVDKLDIIKNFIE